MSLFSLFFQKITAAAGSIAAEIREYGSAQCKRTANWPAAVRCSPLFLLEYGPVAEFEACIRFGTIGVRLNITPQFIPEMR